MKYKVIISDRARESFALHLRFLAQASKSAAVKLKHRFLAEIRSLQEMPQRTGLWIAGRTIRGC